MFTNIFSLLVLLLLHVGCFTTTISSSHRHRPRRFSASQLKKKLLSNPKTASLLSFLNRIFSPSSSSSSARAPPPSVSSSTRLAPTTHDVDVTIHTCPVCSEVFQTPPLLLHHHHSTRHPILSELADGDNILRMIFKMGWPDKAHPRPTIHRILKIHHGPKTLARFEEHREWVKSRINDPTKEYLARCAADGNELLRFHCTTFTCQLETGTCGQQHCSACWIVRGGFSRKVDGISTMPTSWRANGMLPEDLEEEFGFMGVKRVLIVCRVVAGRVRSDPGEFEDPNGSDSAVGGFEDELVVFNPRAVLPCFLIVYTL